MSPLSFSKKKPALWRDWRWQIGNAARKVDDLPSSLRLKIDETSVRRSTSAFPMFISPYYLSLINRDDPMDPLLKMAVPSHLEVGSGPNLYDDPIDENEHSPIPGVIRRYPDRALLLVSGRCAVNCRHCTRRQLGAGNVRPMKGSDFGNAMDYLRSHPEIKDVILSGGDPLLLEDDSLSSLLKAVRQIKSVEIIRVGTRVPVTLPMRVTESLVETLSKYKPVFVNTQFNHPREITQEAIEAVSLLVDHGIPVANQAVLLRGVNDNLATIEQLCRSLMRIRVRPYYLFLCDLWNGIEHFRTSVDTGIEIMAGLRGRVSGLAIPQLIADLPGGIGKIPIGPNYIEGREGNCTLLRSPDGRIVRYPDPLV